MFNMVSRFGTESNRSCILQSESTQCISTVNSKPLEISVCTAHACWVTSHLRAEKQLLHPLGSHTQALPWQGRDYLHVAIREKTPGYEGILHEDTVRVRSARCMTIAEVACSTFGTQCLTRAMTTSGSRCIAALRKLSNKIILFAGENNTYLRRPYFHK